MVKRYLRVCEFSDGREGKKRRGHQDGYVTTYASLDPNVTVSVGQAVSLGQTIGYVGVSAMLETALGEHVHFSVTCNGVSVDPETFFALN